MENPGEVSQISEISDSNISRYEVKPEEWGPDKFSPYCSGGGYTLNPQAIHVSLSNNLGKYFVNCTSAYVYN